MRQGGTGAQGPRVFRYDTIQRLASVAPTWAVITSFDCRDSAPPITICEASRLLEMYASKALSRSTLVVGLTDYAPQQFGQLSHISAAFFRPLEYVLELVDTGDLYNPISAEDLQYQQQGIPATDWCLPLHMQLPDSSSSQTPSSSANTQYYNLQSLATAALSSAAYWCLVHKYHGDTAKCDFNWTCRDLVTGLVNKTVSPYTQVIGINVHKDRNLPWMRPSLFIPLAVVLQLYQEGIVYPAVTKNDLITLNTMGFKGVLSNFRAGGIGPGDMPSSSQELQGGSSSGTFVLPDGKVSQEDITRPSSSSAAATTTTVQMVATPLARPTQPASSQDLVAKISQKQPQGLLGCNMAPKTAAPSNWDTPIFRLFLNMEPEPSAGHEVTSYRPMWWQLSKACQVQGPFTSEQMMLGYMQGYVTDNTYICGTGADVLALGYLPHHTCFQQLSELLLEAAAGQSYRLVHVPSEQLPNAPDNGI